MSYILFRKQIGQQGVLPGQLLMESNDDLATITMPGYIKSSEDVLPTDVITAVYGNPMVNKQEFNPLFIDGVITLDVIGGGGSINGAINVGSGVGLFKDISGDILNFKTLIAGANVTITPTGVNEVTLAATGSGGGTVTGAENVGSGQGHVYAATAGPLLQLKTFSAGSNVVITENSTEIIIAATPPASTGITALTNIGGGAGVWDSTTSGIASLNSLAAGAGISISVGGGLITITNTGGSGGGFEYQNAYWVAQNGNDANNGLSINSPKLTIAGAIAQIISTGDPTANNVIIIPDSGIYTDDFTVSMVGLSIFAPNATVSGCTITMSVPAAVTTSVYGNLLVFKAWNGVTYNDTSVTRVATYDEIILQISSIANATNLSIGARNTNVISSLFNVADSSISCSNTATLIYLNISETASSSISALYNPLNNCDFASWVNVSGVMGKVNLTVGVSIGIISLGQNIDPKWIGSTVQFSPSGDINLSFPDSVDATIPIGWQTTIFRNGGTGNVQFVAPGAVTLLSPYNNPETAGNASVVYIRKVNTQFYILSGDLQNA